MKTSNGLVIALLTAVTLGSLTWVSENCFAGYKSSKGTIGGRVLRDTPEIKAIFPEDKYYVETPNEYHFTSNWINEVRLRLRSVILQKQKLNSQHVTPEELAEFAGMHVAALNSVLNDYRGLRIKYAAKLAEYLGIDLEWLLALDKVKAYYFADGLLVTSLHSRGALSEAVYYLQRGHFPPDDSVCKRGMVLIKFPLR